MFSKLISFFTDIKSHTRQPVSDEDWELCYKTYGNEVEGFEGIDLDMDTFKAIDRGLGAKTKITVSKTTPFAVFINIKRLIFKTELPHLPQLED